MRSDSPGPTFRLRVRECNNGAQVGSVSATLAVTTSWQQVTVAYNPTAPGQSTLDLQAYTTSTPVGMCFQADDAQLTH